MSQKLKCQQKNWLFTNYASQYQGQRRDRQGQGRDKQGYSLSVPACPCLVMLFPACPCLSLSVPVCTCLSLSVPVRPNRVASSQLCIR